MYLAANNKPE